MKVYGYSRVSVRSDSSLSTEIQRSKIRGYAKLHGLHLVEIVDEGVASGVDLKRKRLTEVLANLKAGRADGLVVMRLDRLTRSMDDLTTLMVKHFGERGSRLMSVTESIDTRTAFGRMALKMLALHAELERDLAVERTREALQHLRDNGRPVGPPPLGFVRGPDGRLTSDASEQATLARARELAAGGAGLHEIARALTAEQRPTKRGGSWRAGTVAKLLARKPG